MKVEIISGKEEDNPRLYTVIVKHDDNTPFEERKNISKEHLFDLLNEDDTYNEKSRIISKKSSTNVMKNETTFFIERHN